MPSASFRVRRQLMFLYFKGIALQSCRGRRNCAGRPSVIIFWGVCNWLSTWVNLSLVSRLTSDDFRRATLPFSMWISRRKASLAHAMLLHFRCFATVILIFSASLSSSFLIWFMPSVLVPRSACSTSSCSIWRIFVNLDNKRGAPVSARRNGIYFLVLGQCASRSARFVWKYLYEKIEIVTGKL